MKIYISFFVYLLLSLTVNAQSGKYTEINASQADSLVKANKKNPKFVILDIRTPAEYVPKHLDGAINRNYYETFDKKLDSLDKQKLYLLHCQSGSRSAGAFAKMKTKNFKEVYNLKGGIKDWINAGLPVTSGFSSLLLFASDTLFPEKPIAKGNTDTIKLKITNRANDTLKIFSYSNISNPEFSCDFNRDTFLLGAADYSFNILYTPNDESPDSLIFTIQSNGGNKTAKIYRRSILTPTCDIVQPETLTIYPNPAENYLFIDSNKRSVKEYLIIDINSKIVKRHVTANSDGEHTIIINDLKSGVYFIKEITPNSISKAYKFIKN
ncbi:MAG: rhodanese-like domain-containing protein [Deltaproteobacteria bacterium]